MTREFARDPAVVDLELSSADSMPFIGGVGGEVTPRSDLSDADLRASVDRVREFVAHHGADPTGTMAFSLLADSSELFATLQLGAPAQAATAIALGERSEVARVVLSPGFSMELVTIGKPSDADLAAYAAPLKALAEPGDRVCIDASQRGSFCVTAAEQLTSSELTERAARDGRPFVDAWNAREWGIWGPR